MIKGILFDMDGVLFDSEKLAMEAGLAAASYLGFKLEENFMLSLCGITEAATAEKMQQKLGESFDYNVYFPIMKNRMMAHMEKHGVPVKPGVQDTLEYLKSKDYSVAIASSNGTKAINGYLEATGLAGFFDVIVSGNMVERSKPAPEIFEKAAAALGLSTQQCVAVEDSHNGIISASDAGCVTVMVPDLILPTEALVSRCAAVLESLSQFPGFLETGNKNKLQEGSM